MKELMEIPGGDWERVDIGRMNLICARNADEMEVLEPLWLRKEIAEIVKRMWNKYEEH